ncbi:MAG: hypothetical protein QGI24_07380 [Kiritimatiellia bacterium]|jgi:hypothetical protein|nr:hypothetical protein [Kiritimatiellia bacterium]MDP6848594.1 hypothetical protein [Kiritimatiellia bacterium]
MTQRITSNFSTLIILVGLLFLTAATSRAAPERYRLYTKPDPTSTGGMKGHIYSPKMPIQQVLAIPPDEPRIVYKGDVSGADSRTFSFTGLPMRKYDLVVIFETKFYEGLQLHREENTLTKEDLKKIDYIVQKSDPYFTKKVIHRVEGTTGRANLARCIITSLRDKGSADVSHAKWRRTFKLIMLKDVGPGWQVVRSRDLYPVWIESRYANPPHYYSKELSRIRVTNSKKDLGEIDLKN